MVKRFMTEAAGRVPSPSRHDPGGLAGRADAGFRLVTPKALRSGTAEIAENPRSRSARLRALECIGPDGHQQHDVRLPGAANRTAP